MLEQLMHPDAWMALLSLTALEIVLGIDNLVFIAILADRLPKEKQALAYRLGLGGALITRVLLLFTLSWVMGLTEPVATILGKGLSGRDFILLGGGLFLIGKSSHEMYDKIEGAEHEGAGGGKPRSLTATVVQIMLLDVVFSLDSVITAVGMTDKLAIMVTAVVIAIAIMIIFAQRVGEFVNRHPTLKILALSFLLLIGVLLIAEGLGQHVDKGTIYFAMGFALVVELINMRVRKKSTPRIAAAVGSADLDELPGFEEKSKH